MRYSPAVIDHFDNPRNSGVLDHPDAVGKNGTPGGGNYMIIQIHVAEGHIAEIRFQTYGCPAAIACGSMITELAKGKTLAEARAISEEDLAAALGNLPAGKEQCGHLAVGALRDAIDRIALPPGTAVSGTPQ